MESKPVRRRWRLALAGAAVVAAVGAVPLAYADDVRMVPNAESAFRENMRQAEERGPDYSASVGLLNGPAGACAATPISYAGREDLLVTASHCAPRNAAEMRETEFFPGLHDFDPVLRWSPFDADAPNGSFTVKDVIRVSAADVAFVRVGVNGRNRSLLEEVPGLVPHFQALSERDVEGPVSVIGYPNLGAHNPGTKQVYCESSTSQALRDGLVDCRHMQAKGASGGPVMVHYHGGVGRLIGVVWSVERDLWDELGITDPDKLAFERLTSHEKRYLDDLVARV